MFVTDCIVLKIKLSKDKIYIMTLGPELNFDIEIKVGFRNPVQGRDSEFGVCGWVSKQGSRSGLMLGRGLGMGFKTGVMFEF